MTKKQCKNKIANLEGRIDKMQEQVIHYRRQVKVLDAEDSKKLLEKYHIESEELADLLMNRGRKKQTPEPEDIRPKRIARTRAEVKPEPEDATKEAEQREPEPEPEQVTADTELEPEPEHQESDPQPVQESHTSMMDAFRKEAEQ